MTRPPDPPPATGQHTTRSARLLEPNPRAADTGLAAELAECKLRLAQALDELRATQSKLFRVQKLETLSLLAAGIAHEINTPAQYVTDNVSFLQRAFDKLLKLVEAQSNLVEDVRKTSPTSLALEAADTARREVKLDYLTRQVPRAIEQSMQGLEQISSIVKAMKEFSHPSGVEKQPSDLHELIECVTVVARSEWRYVAEIDLDFDWNLPPVPLIRNELGQVMLNLIVNAAQAIAAALPQASSHKGRIVIATKLADNQVRVLVSDNGGGIPEAARGRVFEPGFSTKPTGTAAGQGLAHARAIVEGKHGGTIDFETTAGGGTTFVVCLPLSAA
jgi:two-component system, NtrC family, sensor kinase